MLSLLLAMVFWSELLIPLLASTIVVIVICAILFYMHSSRSKLFEEGSYQQESSLAHKAFFRRLSFALLFLGPLAIVTIPFLLVNWPEFSLDEAGAEEWIPDFDFEDTTEVIPVEVEYVPRPVPRSPLTPRFGTDLQPFLSKLPQPQPLLPPQPQAHPYPVQPQGPMPIQPWQPAPTWGMPQQGIPQQRPFSQQRRGGPQLPMQGVQRGGWQGEADDQDEGYFIQEDPRFSTGYPRQRVRPQYTAQQLQQYSDWQTPEGSDHYDDDDVNWLNTNPW